MSSFESDSFAIMSDVTQPKARRILNYLAAIAFEDCLALSKEFRELPMSAGIYAVRHRTLGILYIGKTRLLRDDLRSVVDHRFRGGHKALLWAFIEGLAATDTRITFYELGFEEWMGLSAALESLIIQAVNPPYNVRIPARE
jgi:excinuclease UvrABC nuclease subunit